MRKYWLIFTTAVFFLAGCHQRMEYEPCETKDKSGILFSDTGWNTSHTISEYFSYLISGEDWQPGSNEYEQYNGMTVKVCGWIFNDQDGYWPGRFYFTDNPLYSTSSDFGAHVRELLISYNGDFPEDMDITKKCYVVGTLGFWWTGGYSEVLGTACYAVSPKVNAYELYFEE